MSAFLRMFSMKMSHNGTCRKCNTPRDKGRHTNCDRWPSGYGMKTPKGIHYTANSQETTVAELKKFVSMLVAGEDDDTPIQFEIRARAVFPPKIKKQKAGAKLP